MIRPFFRTVCVVVVLGAILGVAPGPAAAQITVFPVQGLAFGSLQPGLDEWVPPTDANRRAVLDVRGRGRYTMDVQLPMSMTSALGHRVPLSFSSSDGVIQYLRTGRRQVFDPSNPVPIRLHGWRRAFSVFLGGTAQPAANQPPGRYSAVITVVFSQTGT